MSKENILTFYRKGKHIILEDYRRKKYNFGAVCTYKQCESITNERFAADLNLYQIIY